MNAECICFVIWHKNINQLENIRSANKMLFKSLLNLAGIIALSIAWCEGLTNLLGTNYELTVKDVHCISNPEFMIHARCHEVRLNRTTNHAGIEFFFKPGIVIRNFYVSAQHDFFYNKTF